METITQEAYDNIRATFAQDITKAEVIGDLRRVIILSRKFIDNFPKDLVPIEQAVREVFRQKLAKAKDEYKHICPVCKSTMYDQNCPDDMIRAYCAKCGRTYTPMGYDNQDDYGRKWFATLWNGGDEPKEIIEVP